MITDLATRPQLFDLALPTGGIPQSYAPGTVLFEEGTEPAGIHIVRSGTIELLHRSGNSRLKKLNLVHEGHILGLGSIVSRRPHDCTARVRTESELEFIDQATFMKTLQESPASWLRVLRLMSQEVNHSYDSLRAAVNARS